MKEKFLYVGMTFITICLLLFLKINSVEPFENFSLRFNDINFELQNKEPSKDIVFVAVDEQSVNKFGRWPWDRKIIAKGIDKLFEAEIVLMDMIFSEPTDTVADQKLADSLANLNASVCGFFLRHNATQKEEEEVEDILSDSSLDLLQSQIVQNKNPHFISASFAEVNILPIMQTCSLFGSFSTLAQSDKLFRSYPLAVYYKDALFPSLGVQGIRLKYNSDLSRMTKDTLLLNKHIINIDERGFVRLNFYKREQYNIISFLDIVENKIKPAYFKDKIVIFGITEVGSGDVVSTPIGFLYGPLLHYTFISNFLENHLIIEPKNISILVLLLVIIFPLIVIWNVKLILHRIVLYMSFYIVTLVIVRVLFVYEMIYIDMFYPLLGIFLSSMSMEALAFRNHENSSKFLKEAFSSYLSKDLLQELIKNPQALTLGGEKKELSILFSDIRGFTTLSELMDPVDLVHLLNRYFTPMTDTVLQNKGMLDKYIGDALMAFYNAPIDVKNHADMACKSALEMLEHLQKLNEELQEEGIAPLEIGIGINTGSVVVGNMGSQTRFNYTIMGDGVNLASRLESLTKNYGIQTLISEFTVNNLTQDFLYRKLEPVVVKGKKEAVVLYELLQESTTTRDMKLMYDEALRVYMDGSLREAEVLFKNIVNLYDDSVSKYFLQNIYQKKSWGICVRKEK